MNVGAERAWRRVGVSVPGVMVLFSDFGRELAKEGGVKGEALIAGRTEGGRTVPALGVGISGLGGWARRVGVSTRSVDNAVGVEGTGGGIRSNRAGSVEPERGRAVGSFEVTTRREEVDNGCFRGLSGRVGRVFEDRFRCWSFSFMESLSSLDDLLPILTYWQSQISSASG